MLSPSRDLGPTGRAHPREWRRRGGAPPTLPAGALDDRLAAMMDRRARRDRGATARRPPGVRIFLVVAALLFGVVFALVYRAASRPAADGAAAGEPARNLVDVRLLELARDPETVGRGADVFRTTCAACHGAAGEGLVGPSLVDRQWIHGDRPETILAGVHDGYPGRGMPGWEPILGRERSAEAAAYVLTLADREAPDRAPVATAPPEPAAGAQGVNRSTSSMPSSKTRPTNGQ
jgi:mono/diheme cytochrome c family protein